MQIEEMTFEEIETVNGGGLLSIVTGVITLVAVVGGAAGVFNIHGTPSGCVSGGDNPTFEACVG